LLTPRNKSKEKDLLRGVERDEKGTFQKVIQEVFLDGFQSEKALFLARYPL
jgi:hypothetical protein